MWLGWGHNLRSELVGEGESVQEDGGTLDRLGGSVSVGESPWKSERAVSGKRAQSGSVLYSSQEQG